MILNEGKIAVDYVGSSPTTRAIRVKLPIAKKSLVLQLILEKLWLTFKPTEGVYDNPHIREVKRVVVGLLPLKHLRFRVATDIKSARVMMATFCLNCRGITNNDSRSVSCS